LSSVIVTSTCTVGEVKRTTVRSMAAGWSVDAGVVDGDGDGVCVASVDLLSSPDVPQAVRRPSAPTVTRSGRIRAPAGS
jgi:hypothetical protein